MNDVALGLGGHICKLQDIVFAVLMVASGMH